MTKTPPPPQPDIASLEHHGAALWRDIESIDAQIAASKKQLDDKIAELREQSKTHVKSLREKRGVKLKDFKATKNKVVDIQLKTRLAG